MKLLLLLILFSCASNQRIVNIESDIKANTKYVLSEVNKLYDIIELNEFLIEALFGQFQELERDMEVLYAVVKNGIVYYIVKKGNTLWWIASEYLNDPTKWVEITHLNELSNPNLIYPDQVLKLR